MWILNQIILIKYFKKKSLNLAVIPDFGEPFLHQVEGDVQPGLRVVPQEQAPVLPTNKSSVADQIHFFVDPEIRLSE